MSDLAEVLRVLNESSRPFPKGSTVAEEDGVAVFRDPDGRILGWMPVEDYMALRNELSRAERPMSG